MSLKLFSRARQLWCGPTKIRGTTWLDSLGRIFPGAFLPDGEHGSGAGDCVDGGGRCPEKGERPDPAEEIV
jgi:hypothetical protein